MPWCDACARWLSPASLDQGGRCPSCGRPAHTARSSSDPGLEPAGAGWDKEEPRLPWHFWLLVGSAAIYLGWRAIQGIAWLVERVGS